MGFVPVVSRRAYNWLYENLWESKNPPWNKRESYLVNRYWRNIDALGIGLLLIKFIIILVGIVVLAIVSSLIVGNASQ